MSEHAILILLGIAGVAATFSGFSGVVAVFGDRAIGNWSAEERFRMVNMLILSLSVCLFCFVPLIEELYQFSARFIWMSSSLILGASCLFYLIYAIMVTQNSVLHCEGVLIEWVRIVFIICLSLAAALQGLNVAGVLVERGPGPFISGLVLVLILAGLQFAFLVLMPLGSPPGIRHA